MGTHRSLRHFTELVVRLVAAITLLAGTTIAAMVATSTQNPAAATSWPDSPAYKVVNQSFTAVGTDTFTIPAGTASISIVAQGGAGQNGGGDGGGGANPGVTIFGHIDTLGLGAQAHPGDTLTIQVGGKGGHNSGSTCKGGDGGRGLGTGRGGGQGGQCSFVKIGSKYFAIAGGGGGGGGQGGGAVGAGSAGAGGHDAKSNSSFASGYFGAFGQGGSQFGSGAGGGGTDTNTCRNSISVASGGNGAGAPDATLNGGGGGGGGGCGGGGGGGTSFFGGGGGAGGNSAVPDGPQDFGVAESTGDGSVVVYAFPGRAPVAGSERTEYSVFNGQQLSTPVTNGDVSGIIVPKNAVSMQYMAYGVSGNGGGLGGLVFGTAAVGGSSPLHNTGVIGTGSFVDAGAAGSAPHGVSGLNGAAEECAGGAGGNGTASQAAGQAGGGCSFVFSSAGFTAIGGGGGGSGDFAGGASGHPGQGGGLFASGGGVGTCDGSIQDGGAGGNASEGFYNGSGGGGGGCGTSGFFATGGGSGGGGGGGGPSTAPNGGFSTGQKYLASQQDGGVNYGFAAVWFTYGDTPVFTSANSINFVAGQNNAFEVDTDFNARPVAALSEAGALPAGVTFHDNGDGSALISGTPSASDAGAHPLVFTADNAAAKTTQNFTLNVVTPPAFTSPDNALFPNTHSTTFTVQTSGFPHPAITESKGAGETDLPAGVTFHDNGDGTATISGQPASGTHDNYTFTLTASNGFGVPAVQHFTLTVQSGPTFTSANTTTFTQGTAGTFLVTTNGSPGANLQATAGPGGTGLPAGVTFVDNGNNGTGTLSGTPTTNGVFTFQISAINVLGSATQTFTLVVQGAPFFTSGNSYTYNGSGGAFFRVTTQAQPTASLSIDPATPLPGGISFTDNHDGTGNISGTPTDPSATTVFTIKATNTFGGSSHTATQSFTFISQGPPVFTSPDHVDFTVGQPGTFNVTVSANPVAGNCSGCGGIIRHLDLDPHHNVPPGMNWSYTKPSNTATISGTPDPGSSGIYTLTIGADNSVCLSNSNCPTQTLTIRVFGPPVITSPDHTVFAPGRVNTFNVTANGQPYPTFSVNLATLPPGVTLINDGLGQARLTGNPPASAAGQSFTFDITADNGNAPPALQHFTLGVAASLQIPDSAVMPAGDPFNFSAHALDSNGQDLGNVTGDTTFTVDTGSCSGSLCSSNVAGDHTVTGTYGSVTGTGILHVVPRDPNHLVLTPDPATVLTGTNQQYDVDVYDSLNNRIGSVNSVLNTLNISGGGSCYRGDSTTKPNCTPTSDGAHTVTATYGTSSGTATLNSFTPVTLAQGSPTTDDTTYGTPYTGQLTVTNGSGPVTWVPTSGATSSVTVGPDGAVTAPGTLPVGAYTVGGTNSTSRGDAGTWTFTLNVQRAPLTVTANDTAADYGGPEPSTTPQYSGFVNGEHESVLTGTAVCTVDYTVGEPVGVYPNATHCTGPAQDGNYALQYLDGTLTVSQAQLTVTASSGSGPYGSPPPAITPSYSGFAPGEGEGNLTPPPTCDIQPASHSDVGVYTTSCSGAVDPNYTFNYVDGTYEVTPVDLTIAAPSQSFLVGDPIPATFAPIYTGLTNGDLAPKTPPTCTTTATTGDPVGTYPITCVGAVDGNYNIAYQAGVLSIVGHATTTDLSIGTPALGQPFTATATVAPVTPGTPPSGTVSFYVGFVSLANPGTLLGTSPLNGLTPDVATLTVPSALPGAAITAVYNGDFTYASSVSPPQTVATTGCLTGAIPKSFQVKTGTVCVANATIAGGRGSITVAPGGTLLIVNSTLKSVTVHGTATICGSSLASMTASKATGLIVVGDPREGCAPNAFSGTMNFVANHFGLVVIDNTYGGRLGTRNNSGPGPLPGDTGPIVQGNRKV